MIRDPRNTLAVLVVLFACAPANDAAVDSAMAEERSTAEDVAALNALTEREMDAFIAGDVAALQTIATDDCILYVPESTPVACGPAFGPWVKGQLEQFTVSGGYTDLQTEVSGDIAFQRYGARLTMTPRAGGDAVTENVNGVHIFRRQADGAWRIAYDIWTPNAPNGM